MNICLYGASSSAIDERYIKTVEEFGRLIGKCGHGLVFGGGAKGLMGAAARGVCSLGGRIIGVAPAFFNVDGVLFDRCTEFYSTETMRERKQKMEELSDAFVVVPGGIGTFEEFFEILTLKQLGRHGKPIALYNINNYFDNIKLLIEKAISEKFMSENSLELCEFFENGEELIIYLEKSVSAHAPARLYKENVIMPKTLM